MHLDKTLIVRGAPQEFICRTGCWDELEQHLERRGIGSALVVHGEASWQAASSYFPEMTRTRVHFEKYNGECTYDERDRLIRAIEDRGLQAIVAVGGGKLTDVAKAAANSLNVPVIILPTLASTCAAWTPLSIVYDDSGAMVGFDVYPRGNSLVLLDPQVILDSPSELLIAGIGDTLAKWYEADVIISQLDTVPVEIEIARFAARKCRDDLLQYSVTALKALADKRLNEAFVRIVETNVMVAGMVGGFGDRYGRTAGAHSIHDALTYVPQSHRLKHGMKVAYGVLVQLTIEGKRGEIDALLPFYARLGLPASLRDMELDFLSRAERLRLAERAVEREASIHMMPGDITADAVFDAIERLERYTTSQPERLGTQGGA
ncbi:iron-containing alcohol dehydrogenase family protein [Cohnella cholangitidis]|uniref:Iron-containing alcohol dehydrogenase family protein n=1 Tax=Cohnella cholangitidis TaxID=2598458 RepID=A0A7G5C318_9BACL|nr:iron-containing alcohol dehydrogenase family protein [Cohnella cholangitidis]QMV43602.1 iron-containing alcohol dehydrogenase family protein [Cohnella cholangitidis]